MVRWGGWKGSGVLLVGVLGCGGATEVPPGNAQGDRETDSGSSVTVGMSSDSASTTASSATGASAGTDTSPMTTGSSATTTGNDTMSSTTDPTQGSDGTGGTTEAVTTATTGSASSDGTTGMVVSDAYGGCSGGQNDCLGNELCLSFGNTGLTICVPECDMLSDCPVPPPGGNATIECRQTNGVNYMGCFLNCQNGACPDGMTCNSNDACNW